MPQFQLQPAPFRVPLLDDQGQMVETWRRFFLSSQALINFLLQAIAIGTPRVGFVPDDADAGDSWVIPGPAGSPGPAGPAGPPGSSGFGDSDTGADEQWWSGLANSLLGLFTQGSVLFAGPSGMVAQDNAKLFWDDTNFRLGIGIALPLTTLHVSGGHDTATLTNTDATSFTNLGLDIGSAHNVGRLYGFGASYASSGRLQADSCLFESTQAGGLGLSAASGTAAIKFYTGTLLRATVFSSGGMSIGDSTDPAIGNLRIAGTVTASPDNKQLTLALTYNGVGAMTNGWGLYITAPAGTGTITNPFALVSEAAAGKWGLGITLPTSQLHIQENSAFGVAVKDTLTISQVYSGGNANNPTAFGSILWSNSGTAYGRCGTVWDNPNATVASHFEIWTTISGGVITEALRVYANGNLGVLRGALILNGKITTYNNIATVSGGVPAEYAVIDTTGLTANVAASTLYAVPASGAGMYRISAYVVETTAGSVSSTLPNVQVVYTDNDTNTSVTLDVTPVLGAAGIGQSGALTANTIGTVASGVVPINVKASTTIQYQTVNYASVAAGMAYALHLKCEAL